MKMWLRRSWKRIADREKIEVLPSPQPSEPMAKLCGDVAVGLLLAVTRPRRRFRRRRPRLTASDGFVLGIAVMGAAILVYQAGKHSDSHRL